MVTPVAGHALSMVRRRHTSPARRWVVLVGAAACVLAGAFLAPSSGTEALPNGAVGTLDSTAFDAVRLSDKLPLPTIVVTAPEEVAPAAVVSAQVRVTGTEARGEIAVLETATGSDWVPVTSGRLDAAGETTLRFTQGPDPSVSRVRLSATTRHKAAMSDVFAVTAAEPSPSASPVEPSPPVESPAETPTPSDVAPAESSSASAVEPSASVVETPTPVVEPPSPVVEAPPPVGEAPSPVVEPVETPASPAPDLCGGPAPVREDGRHWVCTFDDEFDGTSLDRRYWIPQQSQGSEFYTGTATQPACALDDPRTVGVADGFLRLNAVVLDDPISCGSKSSRLVAGSVMTHGTFSQTYGKFEVRAKLPDWAGKGYQETFWLWPNNPFKYGHEWPSSGEIDFAEFYSTYPALTVPVMHYLLDVSTISYATNTNIYTAYSCRIRPGQFNTYGLEWSPGLMKILVNGAVCITNNYKASNASADHPDAPFDSPFFLALSQAFGAAGNEFDVTTGPKEAGTTVDYIRVWQ